MEINISREALQDTKVFIGTPMYGGQCTGVYTKSLLDYKTLVVANGIPTHEYFMFNESLITRARNYIADEFLRSDCTHLMFIDADIGFNAADILALASLSKDDTNEYDIIAGPYPKKCIAWEKIAAAVNQGFADKDPELLQRFVGDYVFNPTTQQQEIPLSEPVEVMEAGTGFMMIRRQTFEKFAAAYPELEYYPDHVRTEHFDGTRTIHAYFETVFSGGEKKRYLSEDYMFCQWAREAGMKVWLCPWMQLQHVGNYVFGGSLMDLAQIGQSATADVNQIGGKTSKKAKSAPNVKKKKPESESQKPE